MSDIDWDRLQPLRVAGGSHRPGSGRGCAMNVVSYITGEQKISDYPKCSHRGLARPVQILNDWLASDSEDDLLSPEDALEVVELGVQTIGTGEFSLNWVTWAQLLGHIESLLPENHVWPKSVTSKVVYHFSPTLPPPPSTFSMNPTMGGLVFPSFGLSYNHSYIPHVKPDEAMAVHLAHAVYIWKRNGRVALTNLRSVIAKFREIHGLSESVEMNAESVSTRLVAAE